MKIKSASLIGLISACVILLSQFFYFTFSFIHVQFDGLDFWSKVSEVLFELGWIGILIFFISLYKKSKSTGATKTTSVTLFALVSVCVMVLCDTMNTALYLCDAHGSGLQTLTRISNVLWALGWIGIITFFNSLYKNTKSTPINSPTLIALVSSCVLALRALINITINIFNYVNGSDLMNGVMWYETSAVLGLLGWIGILIFFVSLYKSQQ